MTALTWDGTGERFYETGVDHGVLYIPDDTTGEFDTGVAWNGLYTVTETPSGAEANDIYADNIKYVTLRSVEVFGGTIEAYTYPDEWMQFDGAAEPSPGVVLGQQGRRTFGMSYRTLIGNDVEGTDLGYKLHLVYGATANPSERAYASVNDSPEAITFSWEFSTVPVPVTGYKPVSLIAIDSRTADPTNLAALEVLLYGDVSGTASLPAPQDVLDLMAP